MGTVWVRCPAAAARKIVLGKRLLIGWFSVRIEALQARPLQCYRYLRNGHVNSKCKESIDLSGGGGGDDDCDDSLQEIDMRRPLGLGLRLACRKA